MVAFMKLDSMSLLSIFHLRNQCAIYPWSSRSSLPALNARTLCSKVPGDGEGEHHGKHQGHNDHHVLPSDSDMVQVTLRLSWRSEKKLLVAFLIVRINV